MFAHLAFIRVMIYEYAVRWGSQGRALSLTYRISANMTRLTSTVAIGIVVSRWLMDKCWKTEERTLFERCAIINHFRAKGGHNWRA